MNEVWEQKWSADQQKNLPTRERTFNAGYGWLWIVMLDHWDFVNGLYIFLTIYALLCFNVVVHLSYHNRVMVAQVDYYNVLLEDVPKMVTQYEKNNKIAFYYSKNKKTNLITRRIHIGKDDNKWTTKMLFFLYIFHVILMTLIILLLVFVIILFVIIVVFLSCFFNLVKMF